MFRFDEHPGELLNGEFTEFLPVISREIIRGMLSPQDNPFRYVPPERQKNNMVNEVKAMTANIIFSNNAVADTSIQNGNITRYLTGIGVNLKTDSLHPANKILSRNLLLLTNSVLNGIRSLETRTAHRYESLSQGLRQSSFCF